MTFTAKEDYGLRASLVLARRWDGGDSAAARQTLQARDIAADQQIPEPFLEQVLATLRRAGIITATRGASGGYVLARSPDLISAADVLRALSGPLVPTKLLEASANGIVSVGDIIRVNVWTEIEHALSERLEQMTLRHLVDASRAASQRDAFGMYI